MPVDPGAELVGRGADQQSEDVDDVFGFDAIGSARAPLIEAFLKLD